MNELIESCQLDLTRRQKEISAHVAKGFSEDEISARLHISPATVHNHTRNIRKKIGARSAVDVARLFILSLPDPKKFFIALFFLSVQAHATLETPQLDLRRPTTTRITRIKTRNEA